MADKLEGYTGSLYMLKSRAKDAWQAFQESVPKKPLQTFHTQAAEKIGILKEKAINSLNKGDNGDYSHIYRRKTRSELVRVSAAVMGIEFAYAAETAFVSPTLLGIGVQHRHMTLIWCLSPIVGFFLTPILGSISDRCRSRLGRRRPFIILLSVGIILGLTLVPNGKDIGKMLGDVYPEENLTYNQNVSLLADDFDYDTTSNWTIEDSPLSEADIINKGTDTSTHPWGIFFTVLGTVLLDFDADACQSPSRAYLLDVCVPEDHALGLSTFTIMAGLGGSLGYAMGGVNWDQTFIGSMFGGHVRAVFSLVTILFFGCVLVTLYSFSEISLDVVTDTSNIENFKERRMLNGQKYNKFSEEEQPSYGTINETASSAPISEKTAQCAAGISNMAFQDSYQNEDDMGGHRPEKSQFELHEEPDLARATLREYLLSIVFMPKSLRILCLTNLFCWMSLVCYSLYFTDFVGEAVFGGDPKALPGSPERQNYEEGIRFGCWGMAMYSLSCSLYSFVIEKLVKRYRAKPVYMGSQLVYTVGMIFMAVTRHKVGVIVFSWAAGVMYSTLFTMPYLLVAHYHASQIFSETKSGERQSSSQVRGLGTDVAIVSSMVFLAQFILSSSMGSIIAAAGTTTAVVVAASVLSFCGCISASQVMYLDL